MQVKQKMRMCGVSAAARALGCSKGHLSAVLLGKRKSARLRERARALGIKLPKAPKKEKAA